MVMERCLFALPMVWFLLIAVKMILLLAASSYVSSALRYTQSGKVYEAPSLKTPHNCPMKKSSPRKRQWGCTKSGVAKRKYMDKDKSDLILEERKERKRSKKKFKSMSRKNEKHDNYIDGWNATDGITSSQPPKYEKGKRLNNKGSKFCSHEARKKFQNGNKMDSDDSD